MFSDAIELIHDTIGCSDIRKPKLAYRISTASAKSAPIGLESIDDWIGCLEDVDQEQCKRGGTVHVNLVIDETVRHLR